MHPLRPRQYYVPPFHKTRPCSSRAATGSCLIILAVQSFNLPSFRSPDGTCLLAASEDNTLQVYNLPLSLYGGPPADGSVVPLVRAVFCNGLTVC